MCLYGKTWHLIGDPSYRSLTFNQECSFQCKNSFFVVVQFWYKATFFETSPLKLLKLLQSFWPSETENNTSKLLIKSILLGLSHELKGGFWRMA